MITKAEVALKNGAEVVIQDNTPQGMIKLAIASGADLEKLEKLMVLQERWEANEARKAYHEAMAAFKANAPTIDKDQTVSYGAGKASYKHASLANVTEKIGKELSKHGLSASWITKQNGVIMVTCKITHIKGYSEETMISAPADASGNKNPIQAIGSAITYLERYTLLALTGLATSDQDDDAQETIDFIEDKQLHQLRDMIADTSTNEAKFLTFLKIEDLEKLPKNQFQQAVAALEAKKKAKK